jgi:hypothetical protein
MATQLTRNRTTNAQVFPFLGVWEGFETDSHYVAQAVFQFTISDLCLLSAGIRAVQHHTWLNLKSL